MSKETKDIHSVGIWKYKIRVLLSQFMLEIELWIAEGSK